MDTLGTLMQVTIFGESHGPCVGCVVSGLPAGIPVNIETLRSFLARRAPGSGAHATARKEDDEPIIQSGLSAQGITTGAPIAISIANRDARSGDYAQLPARPSHADYPAYVKYAGLAERSGGGRFSGRLTGALCAAGGLCIQALALKGIFVGAHLTRIGDATAPGFDPIAPDLSLLSDFPVQTRGHADAMLREIEAAKRAGDSVGGEIECAALGAPPGAGEPFFGSVESSLARALFSIPAVKGVQFGAGFALSRLRGSQANDAMALNGGRVRHETNRMGGADGGISNGMPLLFSVAIKPTPTIALSQRTVILPPDREAVVQGKGRHDPCIAPRAVPVVEAAAAIVLMDLLLIGGMYRE